MARADLRGVFTSGAASAVTAQQVFTNRVSEIEAFEASVEAMTGVPRAAASDPAVPRRNVLTYYGTGGIGKTALSTELERRIRDRSLRLPDGDHATARLDFSDSSALDLESLVVRLRGACAGLAGRWDAFDLAFAVWWEKAHPGEPLREFLRQDNRVTRMIRGVDVAGQLEATIADLVTMAAPASGLVGATHNVGRMLYERSRTRHTRNALIDDCPFFEALVEADGDDKTLSYLPSLLGWQLGGLRDAQLVVFLDTFEALKSQPSREFEAHLQRIIYLMPHALFVVTSRDLVDWAALEPPCELDYVGSFRWPNLQVGSTVRDPRQHRVGYLSPENCDDHLRAVLKAPDGTPAMSEPIRSRIIDGSGGLPFYLDLAVAHFLDISARGQVPEPAQFGGSLPTVVTRTMRDLDRHERAVLRAVSLLPSFDVDLAAAAADVPTAAVRALVARPYVEYWPDRVFPYSLHQELRTAVLDVDQDLPDAWSPSEWVATAGRVQVSLDARAATALAERDVEAMVAVLSGTLACARLVPPPDSLLRVGLALADLGHWASLATPVGEDAHALSVGLHGIALRRTKSLAASQLALERALSAQGLSDFARDSFRLHRAHALRNGGRYSDARIEYEALASTSSAAVAAEAKYQLHDLLLLAGSFRRLEEVLRSAPPSDDLGRRTEELRLLGHLHRFNARFDEAERAYRSALGLADAHGHLAAVAKAHTNLAETLCWVAPTEGEFHAGIAIEKNTALGNRLDVLKAEAASAVAVAGTDRFRPAFERCLQLAGETGYAAGGMFGQFAAAFDAALRRDDEARVRAIENMNVIASAIGVYTFLPAIASAWGSSPAGEGAHEWLDEQTLDRWVQVLRRRVYR